MPDMNAFIMQNLLLCSAALVIIVLLIIIELARGKRQGGNLSPLEATQMMNHQQGVIIDIRDTASYRKAHIIDAISMPDIKDQTKKLEKYKNKPLIIVCGTGVSSSKMATDLVKQGFQAYALSGGLRGWMTADMPLIKE